MIFEDTSLSDPHAVGKYVNFFVTYYTGATDQVPHVPDVCYVGGGNDLLSSSNTTIPIPGIGLPDDKLPIRELLFQNPNALVPTVQPVVYFFAVNGHFENQRDGVRLSLASPRLKYAYFSKVELTFDGDTLPDKDEALKLSVKFLGKALPILMKEHWQDWDKFLEKEDAKQRTSGNN
jgi:hypothetical protein